jgi:hypothetical protein
VRKPLQTKHPRPCFQLHLRQLNQVTTLMRLMIPMMKTKALMTSPLGKMTKMTGTTKNQELKKTLTAQIEDLNYDFLNTPEYLLKTVPN